MFFFLEVCATIRIKLFRAIPSGTSNALPASFEEEAKRIYTVPEGNAGLRLAAKFWTDFMDSLWVSLQFHLMLLFTTAVMGFTRMIRRSSCID